MKIGEERCKIRKVHGRTHIILLRGAEKASRRRWQVNSDPRWQKSNIAGTLMEMNEIWTENWQLLCRTRIRGSG